MSKWYNLLPHQRRLPKKSGEPTGMCSEGKKLFDKFCDDPNEHPHFIAHIFSFGVIKGCSKCRHSFSEYIKEITD